MYTWPIKKNFSFRILINIHHCLKNFIIFLIFLNALYVKKDNIYSSAEFYRFCVFFKYQ